MRGEIEGAIDSNLRYLNEIKKVVATALKRKDPQKVLEEASVESCGKSRVLLSGLVEELHRRNLLHLYQQEFAKLTPVLKGPISSGTRSIHLKKKKALIRKGRA